MMVLALSRQKPVFLLLMGYEVSRPEVWSPRRMVCWYYQRSRSDGYSGLLQWKPDCASVVDFEAHCTCSSGTLAFSSPGHPPLIQYKHPKTNTRIGAAVKSAAARHYSKSIVSMWYRPLQNTLSQWVREPQVKNLIR